MLEILLNTFLRLSAYLPLFALLDSGLTARFKVNYRDEYDNLVKLTLDTFVFNLVVASIQLDHFRGIL